jgi:hypothetical protein
VRRGFDRQTAPRESETAVTGDAWIRQPDSPVGSQKLLSQVTPGFDSPESPIGSQKLQSRVTGGFDSPDSPLGVRNCCHG